MGDIVYDRNDLLREFDSVSRSQRSLVHECERQQSRLIQLLHWYDHQQAARGLELRRQSEHLDKETRQQIYARSKMVIRERERLKHLLDNNGDDDKDNRTKIFTLNTSKSFFRLQNNVDHRKRQTYGCLLPQFKAPLTRSSDSWFQYKSNSTLSQFDDKKRLEKQQQEHSVSKFIQSPIEQRNRMDKLINKCLYEFQQGEGNGYDHFLQTSEPNRNAQILAQQIINDKNQNKYR